MRAALIIIASFGLVALLYGWRVAYVARTPDAGYFGAIALVAGYALHFYAGLTA